VASVRFDFEGRTVLVTGGAQGIGYAIGRAFRDANARVAVADLDTTALQAAWGDEPEDAVLCLDLDISSPEAVRAGVDRVAAWQGLDIVVNNAGLTRDAVVWKLKDHDWDTVLAVHLTGTFNVTRAAIPHLRKAGYGRIINVTSYTGLHGNIGQANYAAAKAGIIGFTKTVAKEVASFGITVNAISPNAATRMVEAIPADRREELAAAIPLGRFGAAQEIAPAVEFLASDEAAYITGVVLPVDGGMSM
jgi:3-oxoacyl-[acyl-carrier protein] reductase